MSKVEHPKYEVLSSADNIEIRKYAPMLIAEVSVEGDRKESINEGFRILANYIFGNNTVQENIAMTAPVQQQLFGDSWTISFVMPSEYTLKTLPKPNDDKVKIKKFASQCFVTIKFSGMNSNSNISKHEKQLMQYVQENKLEKIGSPKYAFYNPPWTLPFMKRNEILIEIKYCS